MKAAFDLPISDILPEIKKTLQHSSMVLSAPPGSGKTTIVPLEIVKEPWLSGKKILLLEPRRLAARLAAARMASLLGEKVGETVGYRIRFENRISENTKIEVLTEGILTRRIQNDVELQGVGLIIFDEFHERSIHADLALALCLDLCQLRPDLRILIMSATLETKTVSNILDNSPVVVGRGVVNNLEIEYLSRRTTGSIAGRTVASIVRVFNARHGDILVFLPGKGEILAAMEMLQLRSEFKNHLVFPLYGSLSHHDQDRALFPDRQKRRRIILATSIAESSITIEGISNVIDSGWSRKPRFNPTNGITTLETVRVSKAVATQRAGRAARLGPGYCLRLWTREEEYSFAAYDTPEIRQVDLTSLALELAVWGVKDPNELKWLDIPKSGNFMQGLQLLQSLGALNEEGHPTTIGNRMAKLPLHPRLGYMLIKAKEENLGSLACDLAALLSERDIMLFSSYRSTADIQARLVLLQTFRSKGGDEVKRHGGDPMRCKRVDRLSRHWGNIISCVRKAYDEEKNAGHLLVYAYPDRIAKRRDERGIHYQLSSGRRASLESHDPLSSHEFLVVSHLDGGAREGKIFLASGIDVKILKSLHSNLFSNEHKVAWNDNEQRVVAMATLFINKLRIEEKRLLSCSPEDQTQAFLNGLAKMGLGCLSWNSAARQFQARVDCIRRCYPHEEWPDFSEESLAKELGWLVPYITGMNRKKQLKEINLEKVFTNMIGWEKKQLLEKRTPSKIQVPSGSLKSIEYRMGEAPVLPVRIQEMFGLEVTPVICEGRMVILLHLLTPADRPIQITSDIAGFWRGSYGEVRKELRGKYPKHEWPENPLLAQALKGVKRKKRK